MPGTPDWQKNTQVQQSQLINLSDLQVPNAQDYVSAMFAVSSYQSLRLSCTFTTGYGDVTADFYTSATAATPVYSLSWSLTGSMDLDIRVPVAAQYVQITVHSVYLGTSAVNLYAAMSQIPLAQPLPTFRGAGQISKSSVTLPASGTATYFPSYWWHGRAWINTHVYDTSGKVNFAVNEYAADQSELAGVAFWPGYTTDIHEMFAIPAVLWGVHVTNTDSSASHEFSIYINPAD